MQPPSESDGLAPSQVDDSPRSLVLEQSLPLAVEDDRSADLLETHSIKWNVARIVRLSSGRFALLTHYRAGALDIIKVGTIEEIVDHIPTYEQCVPDRVETPIAHRKVAGGLSDLLADIGLT